MLTPRDIETKEFSRSKFNGYKVEEVESFLDEVLADYITLTEERENLSKRVLSLSEKLETIRDDQEEWKNTLLNTQKSFEDVMAAAKENAASIVTEAEAKAADIKKRAETEVLKLVGSEKELSEKYKKETELLKLEKNALIEQIDNFRKLAVGLYEEQIAKVNGLSAPEKEVVSVPVSEHVAVPEIEAVMPAPEETTSVSEVRVEPEAADITKTIIVPAVKPAEKPLPAEDDDDIIVKSYDKKPTESKYKMVSEDREAKIKDLFGEDEFAEEKKKAEKPAKKRSKFFKFDDDDDDELFDEDDE